MKALILLGVLVLFGPLSVAQESAGHRPPKGPEQWEKEIAAFEQEDARTPGSENPVVFVGSSSIRIWKTLKEDFPKHRVLNRGFGGSYITDAVHFADRLVIRHKPSFIVVYTGGNDLGAGRTPQQVFEGYKALVGKIRAALPDTPIAYISIAGNPKRWYQVTEVIQTNALIDAYTKTNPGLLFIDVFHPMLAGDGKPRPEIFSQDRLHMNAAGYKLWTEIVGRHLPPQRAAVRP
jgi:lysophospholipase L1-like esterase